ncbi:uncharacterized protein LOC120780174 [Bactrocera tryoni]|uniref:uncharacterized protein LOC120780174 n=1 Tax=Bactrocera tryoni TaxID=59916 RepID=UPI001A958530|nr:uncharacterized protein LOC120780174 [Bactrocera tryoni]
MNVEELISEVFSRPALWDQKNKCYHNRVLVEKLWMSVASEMKIPSKLHCWHRQYLATQSKKSVYNYNTWNQGRLKKKWKYLRDQFRCEVRKIPTPKSGDAKKLKIFSTLHKSKKQEICATMTSSAVKFHQKKQNTSNSTAQLLEIEKRKLALLENKKMEKKTVLDEDEAFFVTLLPHIRKLDPENKFLCRMEMQNVLYKYVYAKVKNMPTLSNETSRYAPLSSPISVSSESYQINSLDLSTILCFQPISFTTVEGTNIPSTSSSLVPDQNAMETIIYSSLNSS